MRRPRAALVSERLPRRHRRKRLHSSTKVRATENKAGSMTGATFVENLRLRLRSDAINSILTSACWLYS